MYKIGYMGFILLNHQIERQGVRSGGGDPAQPSQDPTTITISLCDTIVFQLVSLSILNLVYHSENKATLIPPLVDLTLTMLNTPLINLTPSPPSDGCKMLLVKSNSLRLSASLPLCFARHKSISKIGQSFLWYEDSCKTSQGQVHPV